MRVLFGCLAVSLGAVSVALAARYGVKTADTTIDAVISGTVFGGIALCAFLFDAAAVRLWFMGRQVTALIIGFIAAMALIVTFTNSLGALAGRGDLLQAKREVTKALGKDDERKLKRLSDEREAMQFAAADQATVDAARDAAASAQRVREQECDKRGPRCREKEVAEQTKKDALTAALGNKLATERAAKLDGEIKDLRDTLKWSPGVKTANPLGDALEQILGGAAAFLTAWQQAVVAAVFELCLVGIMVIFEMLGHAKPTVAQAAGTEAGTVTSVGINVHPAPSARPAGANGKRKIGTFKAFARDSISSSGGKVEMKALMADYRAWCATKGLASLDIDALFDEIEKVCERMRFVIETEGEQVYVVGAKLKSAAEATTAAMVH